MKRRPRWAVLLIAMVVAILGVSGPFVAIHQVLLRKAAEEQKDIADRKTTEANVRAEEAKARADGWEQTKVDLDLVKKKLERTRAQLFTAQMMRVSSVHERDRAAGWGLLNDCDACPLDLRDFTWRFYARLCYADELWGHAGQVRSIAFSADGKTLASGSMDRTIKLWDVATRQEIATLGEHELAVESVAFSPNGKALAAGCGNWNNLQTPGEVKLWDVHTRQVRFTLGTHSSYITSVVFSPDGRILASASGGKYPKDEARTHWGEIKLWDVATGQMIAFIEGHADSIRSIAFSPDSKTLASASWDKTIKLWDVTTAKEQATLNNVGDDIYPSVAFSPDGTLLASSGPVKFWNVATRVVVATLGGSSGRVTFSADGKTLACGTAVWDVATRKPRPGFNTNSPHAVGGPVLLSPDGMLLAGTGDADHWTVYLHEATERQARAILEHSLPVHSVAFSPDGKTLAVAGASFRFDAAKGEVKLWEVATRKNIATLDYPSRVDSVVFSPDGKTLAVATKEDRTTRLRDVGTGLERLVLKAGGGPLAFSPDSKTLVIADTQTIRLWDVATGREGAVCQRGTVGTVTSLAYNADGRTIARGDSHGPTLLWDSDSGKDRILDNARDVFAVAFSPDGKILATNKPHQGTYLWEVATGRELGRLPRTGPLAFSPDGKTLAVGTTLWNVATAEMRGIVKGPEHGFQCAAFSPDNMTFVMGSYDKTVQLFEAPALKCATLRESHGPLAFSRDGKVIASASGSRYVHEFQPGWVKVWDAKTAQELETLREHSGPVTALAFSLDGNTLACGVGNGHNGEVKLWNLATGQLHAKFFPHLSETWLQMGDQKNGVYWHSSHTHSLAFSPDGKTLAIGIGVDGIKERQYVGGEINLWDMANQKVRAIYTGHTAPVTSLSFSPDGETLAAACGQHDPETGKVKGEVKLWNVATGVARASLGERTTPVRSVTFSPDGKLLASAGGVAAAGPGKSSGELILWDAATGKLLVSLEGHTSLVTSVAFSPDGRTLASGSHDRSVKLWDVPTGKLRATLWGHTVSSVAFSPDGKTLATTYGGDGYGTMKLWDLAVIEARAISDR